VFRQALPPLPELISDTFRLGYRVTHGLAPVCELPVEWLDHGRSDYFQVQNILHDHA
jgi:hypothetical protein